MRRTLLCLAVAALLCLSTAPSFAQEKPPIETAPPGTEPAQLGAVEVVATTLTVDGKTVEAAPLEVEVGLTLTLRNAGDETLRNLTVTLAESGARFTKAKDALGDLAAGATADADFAFVVDTGSCYEFLGVGGEATYEGGASPLKVAVPVSCPGPRLNLAEVTFDGGDGDQVPEPGETLRVFISLVNSGRDEATNVSATVNVSGEGVSAAGTTLTWPDIAPGKTERSSTQLILTIASDAPRQAGCEGGPEPMPLPAARDEEPATDQPAVPPDQVVSSDGSVSSAPSQGGSSGSEPGSTGAGEPGSTGTATAEPLPATVEPAPEPGTIEPDPGSGTVEPEPGIGTVDPAPMPIEPAPGPAPADEDQSVAFQMQISGKASGEQFSFEYANQIFCALEGAASAKTGAVEDAARDAASRGGTAIPMLVAFGVSAGAVVLRRMYVR